MISELNDSPPFELKLNVIFRPRWSAVEEDDCHEIQLPRFVSTQVKNVCIVLSFTYNCYNWFSTTQKHQDVSIQQQHQLLFVC